MKGNPCPSDNFPIPFKFVAKLGQGFIGLKIMERHLLTWILPVQLGFLEVLETTLAGNSWIGAAAQGSDGVLIPGSVQMSGGDSWGHGLVVAMADGWTQ